MIKQSEKKYMCQLTVTIKKQVGNSKPLAICKNEHPVLCQIKSFLKTYFPKSMIK